MDFLLFSQGDQEDVHDNVLLEEAMHALAPALALLPSHLFWGGVFKESPEALDLLR